MLDAIQKKFIYEMGAAFALFYLNEIPSIYKTISSKELSDDIDTELKSGNYGSWLSSRQQEAIKRIRETATEHFQKLSQGTILLVCGEKYNFKPFCDEQGFSHEIIPTITPIDKIHEFPPSKQSLLTSNDSPRSEGSLL
jgi:hypothetical protein